MKNGYEFKRCEKCEKEGCFNCQSPHKERCGTYGCVCYATKKQIEGCICDGLERNACPIHGVKKTQDWEKDVERIFIDFHFEHDENKEQDKLTAKLRVKIKSFISQLLESKSKEIQEKLEKSVNRRGNIDFIVTQQIVKEMLK